MADYFVPITSASELSGLDKNALFELFKNADVEARQVEVEYGKTTAAQKRIEQFTIEKAEKGRISGGVAVLLFFLYVIPCIVYVSKRMSARSYYDRLIANERGAAFAAMERARVITLNCKIIPFLPEDYRSSLALQTMMKYIINGQVDTWRECSSKYDEQAHRWILEQNSFEALQLQKHTAMMTEIAADNARFAAGAAAVAAVGSWL